MINYLVFPGITDQEEEVAALAKVIEDTRPNLLHFKNLNIDPPVYLTAMGNPSQPGIGVKKVKDLLAKEFPSLQFGYYNRTRENFFVHYIECRGTI
jgi:pyruvate-formate lyase-activating enzyme